MGASLLLSNLGAEHLIGLGGAGFSSGLTYGNYELSSPFYMILFAWLILPVFLNSGIFTTYERRFRFFFQQ